MAIKLTEKFIRSLKTSQNSNKIYYDNSIKGFGLRITKSGTKSFILNYRINGKEKRITIGTYPVWSLEKAIEKANRLRLEIDNGIDPLQTKADAFAEWTMQDLYKQVKNAHIPKLAERAQKDVCSMWNNYIMPSLGRYHLKDITAHHIDELHRKISLTKPVRANRVLEIVRHALNLAIRWQKVDKNVANGFRRNIEQPKDVFLTTEQVSQLFVGKYGDDNLIQTFKTKEEQDICRSLFCWINDGSHTINDDLFIQSHDVQIDNYKKVFKEIFVASKHEGHYEMMMGIE
jgi:hypothetical protein